MSARAAAFEKQITGSTGLGFELSSVKFDGFDGRALLEAKGEGYANFVGKDGKFVEFFQGTTGLVNQAKNQLRAAGETPVIWHVAEEKALKAFQDLFDNARVSGIELRHTPLKTE